MRPTDRIPVDSIKGGSKPEGQGEDEREEQEMHCVISLQF